MRRLHDFVLMGRMWLAARRADRLAQDLVRERMRLRTEHQLHLVATARALGIA
ncbi:MAG TPA: hypothetical protein VF615_25630 [Longimicrobiaceae bacterium]